MPTIPSIRTSVENQSVLVLDEHAKAGTFKRDGRNRLLAYVGGFSVVFPYETADGKRWAFRCWHSDISNSKKRYETIAEAIRDAQLEFLCDFDYVEKGIIVDGDIYPTTRMRWVDGVTIKDYIYQHRNSKVLLKALAENFLKMTRTMHEQTLAHGDLQHGNILVDDSHRLHLVDYDSFYCRKLKGEPDTVTGLPDYQHPSRTRNKSVSEKLDYFSELIIYLSIIAIAENPSLADKYKIKDADRLLFSKEDFEDICNSQIYKDISLLGEKYVDLLKVLKHYLSFSNINELEPFELVLQKSKIVFSANTYKAIRGKQSVEISWNVPFNAEIYFTKVGEEPQKCPNIGTVKTLLDETSTFELSVKVPSDQIIKKNLSIEVFDECEINFSADKYYIYPTIPVVLSWDVIHAKAVWLNDEIVQSSGKKVVELSKEATFVLSAEDEFGKKEKQIEIQLIPVPLVKSLLVPTPNIVSNLSLSITQPKFNVEARFPSIEFDFIKAEPPRVPSLTDLGINVELTTPSSSFSLSKSIKKILNSIRRK